MESLDNTFTALADPTRRAILDALADGERSVMELAAPFDMSQPAVSRHLKVLENAGLITRRIDGTRRPCALSPSGLLLVERWAEQLRKSFEARYNRLDAVLAAMPPDEKDTS